MAMHKRERPLDGLTKAQGKRLLSKHLTGDFGRGRWESIRDLIKSGYVDVKTDGSGVLYVTTLGAEWCDKHHLEV